MIAVYHNAEFLNFTFLNETQSREKYSRLKPDDLVKVAEVDTDDLDTAFRLTNHIDDVWTKNSGVTVLVPSRSTSVGDVLERNGKRWLVASLGFQEL